MPLQNVSGVAPVLKRLKAFPHGWDAHKDRHCIWIVTPEGYDHSRVFDEAALATSSAFTELGGSAPIVTDGMLGGRIPIIYGANLLKPSHLGALPAGSIAVNLEQIADDSSWIDADYLTILHNLPVLDYSARNRRNLAALGVHHAEILEIGYSASLTRTARVPERDIDVLFYGSMNERRAAIIEAMVAAGIKVEYLFNVYGEARDAVIARSKIVLNMHYHSSKVFEILRVSYLLSNRICVLTEGDLTDPAVELYREGLAIAPYEQLVQRALALLADPAACEALRDKGFAAISRRSQAEALLALM